MDVHVAVFEVGTVTASNPAHGLMTVNLGEVGGPRVTIYFSEDTDGEAVSSVREFGRQLLQVSNDLEERLLEKARDK